MNARELGLVAIAALAFTSACDNKPADASKTDDPASKNGSTTVASATAEAASVAVPTTPTPTAEATPPTIADEDLSTPADFEESAEKAITKANYKKELGVLEADIGKE